MKFAVRVVSDSEYKTWLNEQKPIVSAAMIKSYQEGLAKQEASLTDKKIALNN
jgi:heme/copper-type cytochrome/quinol oxidase subunit 2